MKQFFKMMFASALGVCVALVVIGLISFCSMMGMVAAIGKAQSTEFVPKKNTVFKLKLDGNLQETVQDNPFNSLLGNDEGGLSLKDIVKSIRLAKANPDVKGIYLKCGGSFSGMPASIGVVRRALEDFKTSGKFVVAYADSYPQGGYYLCSVANKVFLNPQGMLFLNGLLSDYTFYKGLLGKIGVDMQVFKVGTYKGAVEPYLLDKLSDANRAQITSYQQSIWGNITRNIAEARHISADSVNAFVNRGYMLDRPDEAVAYGLVDSLKYETEVEAYVKDLAGQKGKVLKTVGLDKIKEIKEQAQKSKNEIAVLYAEGEINLKSTGSSFPGDDKKEITTDLADALGKLRRDDEVKAVVLRVNSPGGSAYVADQIWHELVALKKVKPVVVSMGDMAASGGYYISCAADSIFAEPTTLTGSIGIFAMFPNLTGLYGKLALTTDIVKTNTYSDIGDPTRPMREDEKALFQASVNRMYDTFLTRCSDGRHISKDSINQIAQGRVWTGEQAIKIGLVDKMGGLKEAIAAAAHLAKLKSYRLSYPSSSQDFFSKFMARQWAEAKVSVVKDVIGAKEYQRLQTLSELRRQTGFLARLPYTEELAPL
jgi:protease-4